ncbi:MAG: S-adenosyl-L-homocysteine hydrolase [Novosphingobium sp.]|nr:S-adenosyl-L-homocysteine hydrolase [Novosphingobium sp.]
MRAAKLRQLDIMLMVGSLRCRTTGQDYRAAYDRFLDHHRPSLGKANLAILSEMRAKLGAVGALQTLDQASVRMANRYGQQAGYGCGDLGEVTAALARSSGEALVHAADMLVGEDVALEACPVQVAAAALPARPK